MKQSRVGRREFVRGIAGSAAAMAALPATSFGTPLPRQTTPKIKFSVIGINHGHINSQVQAIIRGGGEFVSMYAKEPDLTAAFIKTFSAGKGRSQRGRGPRGQVGSTGAERCHSRRTRAARRARDEARQGLHGRQAGHHDARAAGRGASRPGRDQTYLFDHVQRADGEPRHRQGRRAREGRRHRSGRADDRTWPAPHELPRRARRGSSSEPAMAASSATSLRTRPISSSSSPARRRPRSCRRRSATSTIRSIQASRISAT